MACRPLRWLMVTAAWMMFSAALFAHHGGAEYDSKHPVTLHGTVVELRFINPHALLLFNVKDDAGKLTQWTAELQSPNLLSRRGWSRSTVKPGDQIVVMGHAVKNGVPAMSASKITFADGRETPNMGLPADSPN
jgi:hypothetical protein